MDIRFEKVEKKLNILYKDFIFEFFKEETSINTSLLYKAKNEDSLDFIDSKGIIKDSFKVCREFLNEEEIDNIVVIYDCLDRIFYIHQELTLINPPNFHIFETTDMGSNTYKPIDINTPKNSKINEQCIFGA